MGHASGRAYHWPLAQGWGGIQPASRGSHRATDSPTHPLHPPSGRRHSWGRGWALSPAGSHAEPSLQEDRRCDSLTPLPWLWLLQMSPPPGKSNWEMFNKPSYLNPLCLRQDQALTSFGEHIFVLSKHGARSLAKDTNTVQDKRSLSAILYETCLSLKRILRGLSQLLSRPVLSIQHYITLRPYTPQALPGWRTYLGSPGATKGPMVFLNPSGCTLCPDSVPHWVIKLWAQTSAGLYVYPFPQ